MIALRDYQTRISDAAAQNLRDYGVTYLSMECRTGKTMTALVAAEKYGCSHVLFVTKKKAIPSALADYEALKRDRLISFGIEVINYESLHKVTVIPDLAILDEAHSLGSFPKPSMRAREARSICHALPIIYCSGTPSPESYSQLYHQFWVSDRSPWRYYPNFYKWAADYVNKKQKMIGGTMHNDYSHAYKSKIDAATSHLFLSYSQKDAGFSTNIVETILQVRMSDTTFGYIKALHKDRLIMIDDNVILGDTPAKLMSKLHQLSSGTIITEEGEHLAIDTSKADYIKRVFGGKKVAIFYTYKSEEELLHNAFPNWTDSPEIFQASSDKTFICQVRRAREGVRLDSADALIFYNLEYSYLSYEQGKNRLVSKERKTPAPVYFLVSDCGIEKKILEAVHEKKDFTWSYYCKSHGKAQTT